MTSRGNSNYLNMRIVKLMKDWEKIKLLTIFSVQQDQLSMEVLQRNSIQGRRVAKGMNMFKWHSIRMLRHLKIYNPREALLQLYKEEKTSLHSMFLLKLRQTPP
jgi:hypothetical protein